jgi:hypothetical protein
MTSEHPSEHAGDVQAGLDEADVEVAELPSDPTLQGDGVDLEEPPVTQDLEALADLEDDQLRTVLLVFDEAESLPVQDRLELLQRTEGMLAASLEALDGL